MNKTDLINAVAEQADLTKKEAGLAVDAVFESI
ncbi:HU family DNA-binding protein, partial [Staphylococcus aureus]|nr:HU family DNA-binding protein [Staphylococcus aureus]